MIRKSALAALAFAWIVSPAYAVDSGAVEVGQGNDDTHVWRVGLQRDWKRRWFTERSWILGGYWDLQLGQWRGSGPGGKQLWDIGLTPVFRLERAARRPFIPYVEAAVGFHYLSNKHLNRARNLGSNFQFGDHVAVGVSFGPDWPYDVSLRFQHLSNASIEKPNPGINFVQLRLRRHF